MRERERQSFFLRTLPSPIAKCPTFVSSLSACTLVGRTRPELCVCVHEARRKPRSRFFLLLPLRDGFPLAGTFASNFVTLERQRRRTPRRQAVADGRNFAARRYEQRKEGGKGRGERFNRPPSLATNPYVSQPFCSGYPSADEQYLDGNRPISSPLPNPLLSPLSPFLLPSRRVHTESERERGTVDAQSPQFLLSSITCPVDEFRSQGRACCRIFDRRNRFSRIVSRCNRVLSSRGYIIGKLFQRSVFLSFIRSFRYFSSRTKRNCGTRSAGESLIDGRNIVGIASIGGCWWRLDTGNKFSLVQLIKFRREIN